MVSELLHLIQVIYGLHKRKTGAGADVSCQPHFYPELFSFCQIKQATAEKKGLKLVVRTRGNPSIQAERAHLQSLWSNLISNAIKYSPDGGLIRVGGGVEEGEVQVYVSDEGVGIPATEQERIFDRFYRAENGGRANEESSGLGLAIVRRILDLHGSRITVRSAPDQGTRFEFDIPVRAAA